jgi:hypothetical protein
MWQRKGALWVPDGSEQRALSKTADRPHPISIRLGLLALIPPAVATVALLVSIQSLKVSQRAYLMASKPTVRLERIDNALSRVPNLQGKHVVRLSYRFVLHNAGNTPAHLDELHTNFRFPRYWTYQGQETTKPGSIAPRSEITIETGTDAVLSEKDLQLFAKQLQWLKENPLMPIVSYYRDPLIAESHLGYRDIFGEKHSVNWCWTENMRSEYPYPDACTEPKHQHPAR